MASLNPHAVEFSPYCSQHFHYLFVNPNEIVHLYSFTGLTVTAGTPPYQYFTYHHNTNIALVGPAWFTHLPPSSLPPPLLHNNQQQQPVPVPVPVVGEEEKKSDHFRNMKKKFQGREKWREQENKKKKMLREKWEKEEEKKKSEDLPPIKRGGKLTTVMIKNIPNQYTREMLLELLDEHCKEVNMRNRKESSEYDFVYLPIDFKSSCNRGYAFVNFTHPDAAWKLNISWRNRNWPDFRSSKIREITYAKLQGKEALIKQFEDSVFPCDREEYLPVCFDPPKNGSACQESKFCTVGVAAGLQSHSPISKRG